MVLTEKDLIPYKENIALLKDRIKKEIIGNDAYHSEDIEKADDNDVTYGRFLMSKKNNVDEAFKFGIKTLKWRKDYGVHDIKQDDFAMEVLDYKALQLYIGDKKGNVMMIFNVKDHTRNFIPKETIRKYIVYWVDVLFKLDCYMQATIVMNLKDASLKNLDIDIVLQFLDVFKQYYPQAVANILVIKMHWIFETAYKVIKPLMPEEFQDRLKFVDKISTLEEYVNLDEVGPDMEGTAKFDPPPTFINYKQYVEKRIQERKEKS